MRERKYEFIVVGSGAGGATLARELSQRGRDVLVLEQGSTHAKVGSFADATRYYDVKSPLLPLPLTSKEGVVIWRTFQAGGTTVVSCGNGMRCLEKELADLGVDVRSQLNEAVLKSKTAPIPDSLLSEGSHALSDAARSLGYRFDNAQKFIDPALCQQCGACVLGCRRGAKWTMVQTISQAKQAGAEVRYGTRIENVVVERGRAVGVDVVGADGPSRIRANAVVLAAGGLATPALLQRAGLAEAGQALFVDLFVNVYGVTSGLNLVREPSMSLMDLEFYSDRGFVLSPYVNHPRRVRFIEAGLPGFLLQDDRLLGLMVKTRDDMIGHVDPDGSISKVVTPADHRRLDQGTEVAKEILTKAGAEKTSLLVTRIQGAHPGGGAAIGTVVDSQMQTKIDNLFVCDASVLPAAPGLPPILTIVSLAKRLAEAFAA